MNDAPILFKVHATNTLAPNALENMVAAKARNARRMRQFPAHRGSCIIVGGAPSIDQHIDRIRQLSTEPLNMLASVNCVHKWLIDRGIAPDVHIIFEDDIDLGVVLGEPHRDVVYYVCSHCSSAVFDLLEGFNKVLWHYWDENVEYNSTIADHFPGEFMVTGGYTTFFRTLNIALLLGYRRFELFGVDSSFDDDDRQHFAGYPTKPGAETLTDIYCNGRKFRSLGGLILQAEMLRKFCKDNRDEVRVVTHGDGLLPFMLEQDKNSKEGAQLCPSPVT